MFTHLLVLLMLYHWLIVYDSFYIVSLCVYHPSMATHLRFFAIILILILLPLILISLLIIFLL
jgi:hypothetical protein